MQFPLDFSNIKLTTFRSQNKYFSISIIGQCTLENARRVYMCVCVCGKIYLYRVIRVRAIEGKSRFMPQTRFTPAFRRYSTEYPDIEVSIPNRAVLPQLATFRRANRGIFMSLFVPWGYYFRFSQKFHFWEFFSYIQDGDSLASPVNYVLV